MKIFALILFTTFLNANNLKCKSTSAIADVDSCTQHFIKLMKTQWKYDEQKDTHILGNDLEKAISKNEFNTYINKGSKCLQNLDTTNIQQLCGKHYKKGFFKSKENITTTMYQYNIEGEKLKPYSIKDGYLMYIIIIRFNQYGKVISLGMDMKNK